MNVCQKFIRRLPTLLLLAASTFPVFAESSPDLDWVPDRRPASEARRAPRAGEFAALKQAPHEADATNDRLTIEMLGAAREGQWDRVKKLLAAGARREGRDAAGESALSLAVAEGHVEGVRLLIDKGAAVRYRVPEGQSLIGLAAARGYQQIVRLLLRAGADIDARSVDGDTPLLAAVRLDQVQMVDFLLKNGADLSLFDRQGRTPLSVAAVSGSLASQRYLIALGLDPKRTFDRTGRSAMYWAVYGQQWENVDDLLAHGAEMNPGIVRTH